MVMPFSRICHLTARLALAIALLAGFAGSASATGTRRDFSIRSHKVTIAGEIWREGNAARTVVIVVGGSSARTRKDTAPALALLLSRDIAVALMDRRGNGLSTGRFEVPTTTNTAWQIPAFAADVGAVARYLRRSGYSRVVLLGTSMGAWVNDAAAAGSGRTIDAVVNVSAGGGSVGVSDEFSRLAEGGMSLAGAARQARLYHGPQGYDPAADLSRARQPFLWIFGGQDDSNPTELDLERVKALAADGKPYRWLLLADADHELKDVRTGQFDASWVRDALDFIAGTRPRR